MGSPSPFILSAFVFLSAKIVVVTFASGGRKKILYFPLSAFSVSYLREKGGCVSFPHF